MFSSAPELKIKEIKIVNKKTQEVEIIKEDKDENEE